MAITNGYITLANLKTYLKIDDSVDDTILEGIIESASRSIDRIANRRFYADAAATARTYRPIGNLRVQIDDVSSTTGLIVKTDPGSTGTYATTFTLNTDYIVEPTNAIALGRPITTITIVGPTAFSLPVNYWPQVQVTAKWGWPAVPDDIEQATYILSADLYKRRDSVGGVLGISELGAIRMSPLGRDIAAIVRAYRREFFA
jgi:hypothetical protein